MEQDEELKKYNTAEGYRTKYPTALKKLVAQEIDSGNITIPQVVKKYNLRSGSVL